MDPLAEFLKRGATPALSRHAFRRESRNYAFSNDDGNLLTVSFNLDQKTGLGPAAEVTAGCFPKYQLERVNRGRRRPTRVPRASMAMFNWRVKAPSEASYDPPGGEPWSTWWALGERTASSAAVLSIVLDQETAPKLKSFLEGVM